MKKLLLLIPIIALLFVLNGQVIANHNVDHGTENTLAFCNDNIDNDGDIFVDWSDPECMAFVPIPPVAVENTLALCSDNIDNDGDIFVDLSDSDCVAFRPAPAATTTPASFENTLVECSDNIDNDGDIFVDLSDSGCAPFRPAATTTPAALENTAALCTDNIDNDGDIFVDLSDPDCAPFIPAPVATTTKPSEGTTGGGGGGGFGGGSSQSFGGGSSSTTTSTGSSTLLTGSPVSGVASSTIGIDMNCAKLFKTYMRYGRKNDIVEVTRLQAFLNRNLGTKIEPTGHFGASTFSAVKLFQLKYSDTVLKPWVDAGLSTDLTTNPSGYVYKTTQRQINLLECPIRNIPMPMLP